MITSGMLSIKEGRRLLDFPDLNQIEILANASEERIFQILDQIIEEGKFTPPDGFMDLMLAKELVVQYINLYGAAKLEEEKMELLRNFYAQILDLGKAAQPPPPPPGASPEAAQAAGGVPPQAIAPPPPTAGVNSAQ